MDKTVFAILTLLFNGYGVPCFIQGKVSTGIKRIVFGIITFGVIALINEIKGIILAISIFKMTDEEFKAQYGNIDSGIPAMK